MNSWTRKLGALLLMLSMLLAWSGGASAWIEIGPGPTGSPERPGDTDPDDFPIISNGYEEVRISTDEIAGKGISAQTRMMLFLAKFL